MSAVSGFDEQVAKPTMQAATTTERGGASNLQTGRF
jgi:hypothetical protein